VLTQAKLRSSKLYSLQYLSYLRTLFSYTVASIVIVLHEFIVRITYLALLSPQMSQAKRRPRKYAFGQNNGCFKKHQYSKNNIKLLKSSVLKWPVYAGIPYWNIFFSLNFIPALTSMYFIHLPFFFHFSDGVFFFRF